jgi:hypothetical protein
MRPHDRAIDVPSEINPILEQPFLRVWLHIINPYGINITLLVGDVYGSLLVVLKFDDLILNYTLDCLTVLFKVQLALELLAKESCKSSVDVTCTTTLAYRR